MGVVLTALWAWPQIFRARSTRVIGMEPPFMKSCIRHCTPHADSSQVIPLAEIEGVVCPLRNSKSLESQSGLYSPICNRLTSNLTYGMHQVIEFTLITWYAHTVCQVHSWKYSWYHLELSSRRYATLLLFCDVG